MVKDGRLGSLKGSLKGSFKSVKKTLERKSLKGLFSKDTGPYSDDDLQAPTTSNGAKDSQKYVKEELGRKGFLKGVFNGKDAESNSDDKPEFHSITSSVLKFSVGSVPLPAPIPSHPKSVLSVSTGERLSDDLSLKPHLSNESERQLTTETKEESNSLLAKSGSKRGADQIQATLRGGAKYNKLGRSTTAKRGSFRFTFSSPLQTSGNTKDVDRSNFKDEAMRFEVDENGERIRKRPAEYGPPENSKPLTNGASDPPADLLKSSINDAACKARNLRLVDYLEQETKDQHPYSTSIDYFAHRALVSLNRYLSPIGRATLEIEFIRREVEAAGRAATWDNVRTTVGTIDAADALEALTPVLIMIVTDPQRKEKSNGISERKVERTVANDSGIESPEMTESCFPKGLKCKKLNNAHVTGHCELGAEDDLINQLAAFHRSHPVSSAIQSTTPKTIPLRSPENIRLDGDSKATVKVNDSESVPYATNHRLNGFRIKLDSDNKETMGHVAPGNMKDVQKALSEYSNSEAQARIRIKKEQKLQKRLQRGKSTQPTEDALGSKEETVAALQKKANGLSEKENVKDYGCESVCEFIYTDDKEDNPTNDCKDALKMDDKSEDTIIPNDTAGPFTILIGNLDVHVTRDELHTVFATRYPSTNSVELIIDPNTLHCKGASVQFYFKQEHRRALREMQNFPIKSRRINIAAFQGPSRDSGPPESRHDSIMDEKSEDGRSNDTITEDGCVFPMLIRNLDPAVTATELHVFFARRYPTYQSLRLIVDPFTRAAKCAAVIRFPSQADRMRALVALQNYPLHSSRMEVSIPQYQCIPCGRTTQTPNEDAKLQLYKKRGFVNINDVESFLESTGYKTINSVVFTAKGHRNMKFLEMGFKGEEAGRVFIGFDERQAVNGEDWTGRIVGASEACSWLSSGLPLV